VVNMFPSLNNPTYKVSEKIVRLFLAQRGMCFHCFRPMLWTIRRPAGRMNHNSWTKEHIVPFSRGGRNERNIVLAHLRCNQERSDNRLSDILLERAYRIIERSDKVRNDEIKRFLDDRTLRGTYAHCYDWPIYPGEPKFDPPSK
jgi:hypothetical protein